MKKKLKKASALKYRHLIDSAPKVVATGKGILAEQIISVARESGVPIREDKDLVELLSTLDLYQEIPLELYKAIAMIITFVYRMNDAYSP